MAGWEEAPDAWREKARSFRTFMTPPAYPISAADRLRNRVGDPGRHEQDAVDDARQLNRSRRAASRKKTAGEDQQRHDLDQHRLRPCPRRS